MSHPSPARVLLHPSFRRGTLDRRIFGSFLEHLGRAVYTGVHEPGHPRADEHGFREDVAELVRELGVSMVRYPGGNFVSAYRWEDGVGPVSERPRVIDPAWRTIEPNTVGTDEFLQWAERTGVEPMMAVNLGTRGPEAAAALVEYCNGAPGTRWADLRVANGRTEPYGVRLWCLGNEMDGPWQIGQKPAAEYGRLAAQAAKSMRRVDPGIEFVVCGSSNADMPTFGSWEHDVLSQTIDVADHISMHAYYEEKTGDRRSFLASGASMARYIDDVAAVIDSVAVQRRSSRRPTISFDEWNVWYYSRLPAEEELPLSEPAPRLIEDVYSALDAVVVGDLLITLVSRADRVRVACLAQLVNAIAPIMTEPGGPAWRQPTFHPFAVTARLAAGDVLDVRVEAPELHTEAYGAVPAISATATVSPEGELAVFLANRSAAAVEVEIEHPGQLWQPEQGVQVRADDVPAVPGPDHAAATIERHVTSLDDAWFRGQAGLRGEAGVRAREGASRLTLPAESWTALSGAVRPA